MITRHSLRKLSVHPRAQMSGHFSLSSKNTRKGSGGAFGALLGTAAALRQKVEAAHLELTVLEPNSMAWEAGLAKFLSHFVKSVAAERALHQASYVLATENGLSALARREQLTDQLFVLLNSGVQNIRIDFVELQWPLTPVNSVGGHDLADRIKYDLIRKFLDAEFAAEKKLPRGKGLVTASGGSFFLVHAQEHAAPRVLSTERLAHVVERINAALQGFQIAASPEHPGLEQVDLAVQVAFSRSTLLRPTGKIQKMIRTNRRGVYSNLKFVVSGILTGEALAKELLKNAYLRELDSAPPSSVLPKFIPDLDAEGKDIRLHHTLSQHGSSLRLLESFAQTVDPQNVENHDTVVAAPILRSLTDVWHQSVGQSERVVQLAMRDPGFPWFFRRETFQEALEALFEEKRSKGVRFFNLGFSDVNYWYSMNQANPISALDTEFYKMLQLHQRGAPQAKYSFKKSRSDELIFACAGEDPSHLLQRVAREYKKVFPEPIAIFGKFKRDGKDVRLPLFQLRQKNARLPGPRPLDVWQDEGFTIDALEPFRDHIGETSAVVTHIPWSIRRNDDAIAHIIAWADIAAGKLKEQNRRGQNVLVRWRDLPHLTPG